MQKITRIPHTRELWRRVAKLVAARCLLRQLYGLESSHLLKIQNRRQKQVSGQHILARQKVNKKYETHNAETLIHAISCQRTIILLLLI